MCVFVLKEVSLTPSFPHCLQLGVARLSSQSRVSMAVVMINSQVAAWRTCPETEKLVASLNYINPIDQHDHTNRG